MLPYGTLLLILHVKCLFFLISNRLWFSQFITFLRVINELFGFDISPCGFIRNATYQVTDEATWRNVEFIAPLRRGP